MHLTFLEFEITAGIKFILPIKEAIKAELIYAGTAEPRDEKMIRSLKLAFLQLASFLPDDEVVPLFDVDDALDSDDVCHNYYKYLDGSEKGQ